MEAGEGGGFGCGGGEWGGKCRQLQLNNNKIIKKIKWTMMKKINTHVWICNLFII